MDKITEKEKGIVRTAWKLLLRNELKISQIANNLGIKEDRLRELMNLQELGD